MGKKSRENQQKRKETETAAGTSTPTPAASTSTATAPSEPPKKVPEGKPENPPKTEDKKAWKRKDLKKEAAAQAPTAQPLAPQPTPQQRAPQPQQQGWGGSQQSIGSQHSSGSQQSWGGQPQRPQQQGGYQGGQQQGGYQGGQQGRPQQQGGYQGGQQGRPQQQGGYQGKPQQEYQGRSGPPQQQQSSFSQQGRGGQQYGGQQQQSYPDRRPQQGRGFQDRGDSRGAGSYSRGVGGSVPEGSTFKVEANYVDLVIPTDLNEAYHYDVKIDPDKPKKMFRKAVDLYCKQQFKDALVAYDGKASAYSSVKLPEKSLTQQTVTVSPEFGKPREFKVTLSKTKDMVIDMSVLRTYGSSKVGLADKPMRAIQCLEVVLSHHCHEKGVRAGRSFYYRPDKPQDLLDGYELWYGIFQAAILGQRMLLNIDVSHKAFPKPFVPLTELYDQLSFRGNDRNFLELVKGSEIIYTPPKSFDQPSKQYKVNNISYDDTKQYRFKLEDGKETTVFDYFKSRGYTLKFPNYRLVHVGPRDSKTYLPMELCQMANNNVSNKQTGKRQVTEIIKHSAISSWSRKEKILGLFAYFHAKSSPIIEKFGLKLGREFIQVTAKRLFAPKLEYFQQRTISPENGVWNADSTSFFKSAGGNSSVPLKWCVINLEESLREDNIRIMGNLLIKICKKNKVLIDDKPQFPVQRIDGRNVDNLSAFLGECVSKYDFVIVVLNRRRNSSYADVKIAAELERGMLTQCIKADTVEKRANDSTLYNILLKLNQKLNGINQRIDKSSQTSIFAKENHLMLIGADVTHPSPTQRDMPSVVGTCATSDPDCTRYNMQFRFQDPKKEIIVSMKEIMVEHLKVYFIDQKSYPTHILYYRDGVADGQFEQVLNEELSKGMNLAFGEISRKAKIPNYNPKVTCIIVQKRNHTRFFPLSEQQAFKINKNVFPGTCCNDVICHPNEKDFFLVSHESLKGTARPTKYIVIRDDSNFKFEEIQNLTYQLCHLFPRCNRSVSYPAPAYLSHLVAARGKVYIENEITNKKIDMRRLPQLQDRKKIVPRFSAGTPMFFI
ncbi:AGO2 family protein [Megaselia abdita]